MSSPNDYMTPALIRKDRYSAGQERNSSISWKVYYNKRSSSQLGTVPSQLTPDAFTAYFSKICVFRPPTLRSFYTPLSILSPNQIFTQLLPSSEWYEHCTLLRLVPLSCITIILDVSTLETSIHSFSSLSYDRSKAFSKASSPYCAI